MTSPSRFLSGVNSVAAAESPVEAAAVDSDLVVILAALLCALICVVGLFAVARCAWLRRTTTTTTGGIRSAHQVPPPNKGLKKKILQTLPKITFKPAVNGKLADCAICLTEYIDGDEIRVLPQCGHGFHVGCIDTWLGSHSSCPSCRQILVVSRCQKCGGFPGGSTAAAAGGGGVDLEVGIKDPASSANEHDDNRFLP